MNYTVGERHWALYETTRNELMHDWEYRLVRDEHGVGLALPDHPALPALAQLLHEDPGLADAVNRCLAIANDNQWWELDVYNSDRDLVQRLAAALARTEGGDGQT